MSELNRWGLGIMLFLLVIGAAAALDDSGASFILFVLGVIGLVLFTHEGDQGDG